MGTRRATSPKAFVTLLVLVLALSGATAVGSNAQPGVSLPSTGQVIAHGVDTLPGAAMTWRLGVLTAAPGTTAEFGTFDTGFAIGDQQPIITTELPSGESTYLEQGQAMFHAGGSTLRVASASGMDMPYLDIDLTTDAPDPGASWIGEAFTAPAGTHAIRLTGDAMTPSETGTFVPANDLPYMVYAFAGSLQVTDDNGVITELMAGDATQLSGTASLLAGATTGARWMIASIGPQVAVPPLPTPVATAPPTPQPTSTPFGSIAFTFYECPTGSDALVDPSVCAPAADFLGVTLSPQGSTDPTLALMLSEVGVQRDDNVWVVPQVTSGTWVLQPDMGAGGDMRIEMTGDIVPLGGIWGVTVTASQEAEVNVYVELVEAGFLPGSLYIEMYDCPPGVDPLIDTSGCALATDVPNMEVSRITESEMIIYNTLWDAVSPDVGTFIIEGIESGTFMLIPEDGGLWTADWVTMGGDAYWDFGFWQVDIPIGGSAYVAIYHVPPGPPEPPAGVDTGRLWITQIDCPPGTTDPLAEPACYPSEAPWDVTITNADSGETWTLYANATLAIAGSWEFTLPAGNYLIDVSYDPAWGVIYETFATVTEGGLTEVVVYSIAPGEP